MLLEDVLYHLNRQVLIVFEHMGEYGGKDHKELAALVGEKCVAFLRCIPKYHCGFADNDPSAMVNEKVFPNGCARVDIDAGQAVRMFRHNTRN